mmetsp:Transcript_49382/g.105078  ORF Transcript_49382/g.105078 Transcript_49382/m.105078 type:complete len:206 (-) Transcript_49382:785-1402(-)
MSSSPLVLVPFFAASSFGTLRADDLPPFLRPLRRSTPPSSVSPSSSALPWLLGATSRVSGTCRRCFRSGGMHMWRRLSSSRPPSLRMNRTAASASPRASRARSWTCMCLKHDSCIGSPSSALWQWAASSTAGMQSVMSRQTSEMPAYLVCRNSAPLRQRCTRFWMRARPATQNEKRTGTTSRFSARSLQTSLLWFPNRRRRSTSS